MATLNIKNVPDGLYGRLQKRARQQRRSAAQEVIQILSDALEEPAPLSLLQLRGLGKSEWDATEPTVHVEQERRAWD